MEPATFRSGNNTWTPEPIAVKLGMYVVQSEVISAVYS
jgi:hypothetical protein